MWSSWSESAKSSLTQALEKTGDAITKAATHAGKTSRQPKDDDHQQQQQQLATGRYHEAETGRKSHELLGNLQAGWSSVVQTTKASIKTAQVAVEEQQSRLQENWAEQQSRLQEKLNEARSRYYKRDPKLPLDVGALKDAEVCYITDRIISMSHPAMASSTNGEITGERKLAAVGHLLEQRHEGRYMVWNISEVEYETRILQEQVLTFSFPGSPSPPLGLMLKLLISMEAWLKADDRNVAVVHCLTGKGRTSTVISAFLCWMGQAGFSNIDQALEYVAACKQMSLTELTIPSQRRYASYFKNMLDGVRPSQPPLMLKRIIMSEAPRYAKGPPRDNETSDNEEQRLGCAPYIQIFKAGELLHTAPASLHYQQSQDELPFVQVADGAVSFNIDLLVQGDILVRCRHVTSKKQRVSMFRAAFHTGYIPPKVMRIKKSELDGACSDDRFMDDFFLDLIFEAVDAEEASKLMQQQDEEGEESVKQSSGTTAETSAPAAVKSTGKSQEAQALAGGATTVTASTYDTMLHRDSRFWDVIAARRETHAPADEPHDAMWGPTIGRRRDFEKKKKRQAAKDPEAAANQAASDKKAAMETFSIGGEFDFLPSETSSVSDEKATKKEEPPKKDSLMEALMGALGESSERSEEAVEEIVFNEPDASDVAGAAEGISKMNVFDATEAPKEPNGPTAGDGPAEGNTVSASTADAPTEAAQASVADTDSNVEDMDAILADANLNLEDDMDALLADTGDVGDLDADLLDFDTDLDADLEDLESFLSPSK